LYYLALILYSPSISRPSSSPLPSLQPLVSVTEIEHWKSHLSSWTLLCKWLWYPLYR
jgi:hypothetical protein